MRDLTWITPGSKSPPCLYPYNQVAAVQSRRQPNGRTENIHRQSEITRHAVGCQFPFGGILEDRQTLHMPSDNTHMPKGTVVIDRERCKGCGLCIAFCPQDVLAYSPEYNQSGYKVVCPKKPECCIGCAFCAQTCPDVAIEVYREKKSQQRK